MGGAPQPLPSIQLTKPIHPSIHPSTRLSPSPAVVLYESAKAIHGRPLPMIGRTYDNVFTHFVSHFCAESLPFLSPHFPP